MFEPKRFFWYLTFGMKKLVWIVLCCSVYGAAAADPEIKGTAAELAHFINGIPKVTQVTGEAEARVPAQRAVLTLRVATENRSLQEALRQNQELRGKLADHLKRQGIAADRIQASKFSSTPKYGMFSEKARSYRVENMIRVAVQDEKEFQSAAGAVDLWPEVQYGEVEFEYADKEALKARAVSLACDNANERKKIYEEKLGVKLTPTRFNEGEVTQKMAESREYDSSYGRKTTVSAPAPTSAGMASIEGSVSSFGELVYIARVTVEYSVQPK
jgi:uncharacterized protein